MNVQWQVSKTKAADTTTEDERGSTAFTGTVRFGRVLNKTNKENKKGA
jgi:hypothetical protein